MKNALHMLIIFMVVLSSCQKEFSDPNGPLLIDTDAQRFIDSSGISDKNQQAAIDYFVVQLKDSALWPKFIAIYPMVGGSASTNKWNLKDPRNLDSAFRLTFSGNPVFANTGVLFPTTSDYADTHLPDNLIGGYANSALSFYSRTQNSISGYDMGCTDGAIPYNELSIYSNNADNSEWFGFSQDTLSLNTTGLFMLSSSPTNVTRYRNGMVISSRGMAPTNSYTNLTILIGKSRVTLHPGQKECALATIGYGLTDTQALMFYKIVNNFQTALGR